MKKITRIGVGGPVGSGKTALIEAITPIFIKMGAKILIITNDIVTTEDAKHVQRTLKGILLEERIIGVETGACPHTAVREDPSMNLAAVEDMESRFPDSDFVLIESGGDNLTLTFSPALVDFFIYVIDVAAGDKIPRKNGPGISQSDILVINKTDLAPYVGASLEVMDNDSKMMRGDKPFVFTNCKTGEGIMDLVTLIQQNVLFDMKLQHDARMTAFHQPPELAPFQDEPGQLPSGVVGKNAFLRLGFERRGERTALVHLDRRAPLLVQQALYWDEALPDLPCVFIITTTGCILQGDRFNIEIDLASDTRAHVTTQAATKIHSMDANYAAQTQSIMLGEHAYLEYLPDPIIPHAHARFMTTTHVSVHSSATLLYSEIMMAGRKYHGEGELFQYDVFSSTVRAQRPDGAELFAEKFVIEPHAHNVRQVGVMGTFDVFANVVLLTPTQHADKVFDLVPAVVNLEEQWAAGASRLPNDAGLVFKVLGQESEPVRAKVREFWAIVRQTVTGAPVLPKSLWR